MASRKNELRSKVFLKAYDENNHCVLEQRLSFETYYEDLHPLIDDDKFRASQKIRRLTGKIYNSGATLTQEFETFYGKQGEYVRTRAVHEDGTVIED